MANRAYVSIWTRDHSEEMMLDRFERLLETVPLSDERPGFAGLVICAVSPAEAPLVEHDLRSVHAGAADVIAIAREHQNADSAFEVEAYWDMWQTDADTGRWRRGPERLLVVCNGNAYDDGVAAEAGDFTADIGFEHLITGHAGLLGARETRIAPADTDPAEAQWLASMAREESLREYHQKTRENIQQLMAWVRRIEQALPVERYRLWSEGEENLEARLDEILAAH